MQTKPTKKPLILLLLLLVLLGGVTYTMAQGGYLQGAFPGLSTGSLGSTDTEAPTLYTNNAVAAEAYADKVAAYATDARAAKADAKTAAISGDDEALETAISEANTAASDAQTAYDKIETYLKQAKTADEDATEAVQETISTLETAHDTNDAAETAYNNKISPASEGNWENAFDLQDDYDACVEENGTTSMYSPCSDEETDLNAAKLEICTDYYGGFMTPSQCEIYVASYGMWTIDDFEDIFESAKLLFEEWQLAILDTVNLAVELTALNLAALDKSTELDRAQTAYDAATINLAAAKDAATEAAKYTILVCSNLTVSSETLEITDETTVVDFTVTIEAGDTIDMSDYEIMPLSNGLNSLLAITSAVDSIGSGSLNLSSGHGGTVGSSNYEYWSGTLRVDVNSQSGEVSYDGETKTSFDIDLTQADDGDELSFSFSGGEAGDTIDIYVEGETLGCSETITVTTAAAEVPVEEPVDTTDTDGDGLTDEDENNIYFTDPNDSDTDGDTYADGAEVTAGTDPLVDEAAELAARGTLDVDNDGLTGDEELVAGTKIKDSDTDDDGLLDGEEVDTYSTDPLDSDSDSDDLSDLAEVQTYDTDPNDSDTDGDTYADGAEVTAGTDPLDASDYPGVSTSTSTTTTTTTTTTSDEVPTLTRDIILADYTCTDSFTDNDGEWHEDIVCRAKEAGWVKGYTTLLFGPDGDITRAEYVKVLTKIFGLDEDEGYQGKAGFYDVASTDWYYPYINLAEKEDWIRTRDAGYYFNPNTPVTRADAILWAIRAADQSTYTYDLEDTFSDVENDDYFAYALAIANSTLVDTADDTDQPIVEGYTDGTFGPYKNIARSEAMAIATRIAIAWGVASEDWDD